LSRDAKAASRFRGLLASERNSADLYTGVADAATGERRKVLTELAAVQRRHAAHWAAKLIELGEPMPPADRPGLLTAAVLAGSPKRLQRVWIV
jgi:vacuolar iron transporter family protein